MSATHYCLQVIKTACIAIVLIGGIPISVSFAQSSTELARDEIRSLVKGASRTGAYNHRELLERFYGSGDYLPAWFEEAKPRPVVGTAISELKSSSVQGLNPTDYGTDKIEEVIQGLGKAKRPERQLALADVALTLAMVRYLTDLNGGRVRHVTFETALVPRAQKYDPVSALQEGLANGHLRKVIDAAEPRFPLYRRLKTLLARYRELTAQPADYPSFNVRKIKPGDAHPAMSALQRYLIMLGDMPADAPRVSHQRYGPALVEGIKRFQDRHGLDTDGVIGKQTQAALNVPLAHRIRQIELSLERLRWLPEFTGKKAIAINIPSYRLWAFDPGVPSRDIPLTMRIIVGRALLTETPVFIADMRYIEFRPFWNVPRSIERKEIIPKLVQDPGYLQRNDMEIVSNGKSPPITNVDEKVLAGLRAEKLRIRQRPGPDNALGTIKFVLPNSMDIYLHATPARQLFSRSRRDFSHGCIRVENPVALAQYLLEDQPEWTAERIEAEMSGDKSSIVRLNTPVPVVIFYMTAIVDRGDRAIFLDDIYQLDRLMDQALNEHSSLVPDPIEELRGR